MIIFGSRTSSKVLALLFFICVACHNEAGQRLVRRRTWFTLFFVPIFPFGHGSYSVACAYCGASNHVTRETAERFKADYETQQINADADRILAAEEARIAAEQRGIEQ
jgi:zinc-ribbon family